MDDLNFVSPTVGFSAARFLYRTEDGGRTWSIVGPR
jgi:hypothetical protein